MAALLLHQLAGHENWQILLLLSLVIWGPNRSSSRPLFLSSFPLLIRLKESKSASQMEHSLNSPDIHITTIFPCLNYLIFKILINLNLSKLEIFMIRFVHVSFKLYSHVLLFWLWNDLKTFKSWIAVTTASSGIDEESKIQSCGIIFGEAMIERCPSTISCWFF